LPVDSASSISDGKIAKIKKIINERPRKKLNFATPTMIFYKNIT